MVVWMAILFQYFYCTYSKIMKHLWKILQGSYGFLDWNIILTLLLIHIVKNEIFLQHNQLILYFIINCGKNIFHQKIFSGDIVFFLKQVKCFHTKNILSTLLEKVIVLIKKYKKNKKKKLLLWNSYFASFSRWTRPSQTHRMRSGASTGPRGHPRRCLRWSRPSRTRSTASTGPEGSPEGVWGYQGQVRLIRWDLELLLDLGAGEQRERARVGHTSSLPWRWVKHLDGFVANKCFN